MPLGDNGWEDLDPDDALEAERTKLKKYLGQDIDVSDHSPWGQIAQYEADKDIEADEYAHDNYDAAYASFSNGISLDRVGSNFGVQRNLSQSAVATIQITGTPGYVVEAETEFDTDDGTAFISGRDVQLDESGNGSVDVYSEDEADYVNVGANQIVNQAEPVDDVFEVTNPQPATGGADLETDYDYRHRIISNESSAEGPTKDGIKVGLMNVDGVTGVQVIANKSDTTDSYGNPPYSMHVYVMGGQPDAIAQKLVDIAGGEVWFVGKSSGTGVDDSGRSITEYFDQQQIVQIKLAITIKSSTTVDEDALRQSVLDYFDTLEMGQAVILNQLYGYLYQITGVDDVTSITAGTGDTLSADNITIDTYQQAQTTDELIGVTVTNG